MLEAAIIGKPIFESRSLSRAAQDLKELTQEILTRLNSKTK
jgi:cellulose biosynthesis protein BcsQ